MVRSSVGDSCGSRVVGKTAQPRALAMGAGLPRGGKTKNVTSCDNVFLTNILFASGKRPPKAPTINKFIC